MADVRDIIVRIETDTSSLDELNRKLSESAQKLGINENTVEAINREFAESVTHTRRLKTEVQTLTRREEQLALAAKEATDPQRVTRLNRLLTETRNRLTAAQRAAAGLDREMDDVSKSGRKATQQGTRLGNTITGVLAGVAGFGLAEVFTRIASGIAELASESIELFDIQATADAQLKAALLSTNEIVGRSFEELKRQASDLQRVTLFGDEQIQGAQEILLTFTNIQGEIFDRTVPAILDVSTRLGTDLKSAALQVGKALNDPIRGLDGLSRSGIQFSESQKAAIKEMVALGQTAEAQAVILQELERQFSGAARAAAAAGAGGITQLENRISDLKEQIGESLVPLREEFLKLKEAVLGFFASIAAVPVEEQIRGQINTFESLFNTLQQLREERGESGAVTEFEREVLARLNAEYGTYLQQRIDETSTLEQLTAARRRATAELQAEAERLPVIERLENAQRALTDAQNEYIEAQARQRDANEENAIVRAALNKGLEVAEKNLERARLEADAATEAYNNLSQAQKDVAEGAAGLLPISPGGGPAAIETLETLKLQLADLQKAREKINIEDEKALAINGQQIRALQRRINALKIDQKATEDLTDALKKLQDAAAVEIAGGPESADGLRLLQAQAEETLTGLKAFRLLSEEDANALIEAERKKFLQKIEDAELLAAARIASERDRQSGIELALIESQVSALNTLRQRREEAAKINFDSLAEQLEALKDEIDAQIETIEPAPINVGIGLDPETISQIENELEQIAGFMRGVGFQAGDELTNGFLSSAGRFIDVVQDVFERGFNTAGITATVQAGLSTITAGLASVAQFQAQQTAVQLANLDELERKRSATAEANLARQLAAAQTAEERSQIEARARQQEVEASNRAAQQRQQIEMEQAKRQKSIATAQAIIGAANAQISIWSAPSVLPAPIDYGIKAVLAAIVAGATAKQIQLINSAPGFKHGGYTDKATKKRGEIHATVGKKDESGETVAGVAHAGEWVAPKWVVNQHGKLVQYMETVREGKPRPDLLAQYLTENNIVEHATSHTEPKTVNIDKSSTAINKSKSQVSTSEQIDKSIHETKETTTTTSKAEGDKTEVNTYTETATKNNIEGDRHTEVTHTNTRYEDTENKGANTHTKTANTYTETANIDHHEGDQYKRIVTHAQTEKSESINTHAPNTQTEHTHTQETQNIKQLLFPLTASGAGVSFPALDGLTFPAPTLSLISPAAQMPQINYSVFSAPLDGVSNEIKALRLDVNKLAGRIGRANDASVGHRITRLEYLLTDKFKGRI